ncbi:TerB family tellurite resistance protein [Ruegeria pomeroyi]|nr:TerB family tellurite resistance protein [Ruegeria pomeroyi]
MTTPENLIASFNHIERVVRNEDRFKAKVGAGASVFASLKLADLIGDLGKTGSFAGAGAGGGSLLASAMAPKGIAALMAGLFNPFSPVPYIVGASVASAGMFYGVTWLYRSYYRSRVDELPRFLNTPIDVLGASFLDLVGSLAVKVASIDGHIHDDERRVISEYFVEEWGYDPDYTSRALDLLVETTEEQRVGEMAASLAEFARTNPDCDFSKIKNGLNALLTEIAEADGKLDEREEMAIERIVAALDQEVSTYSAIKRAAYVPVSGVTSAAHWLRGKIGGKSEKEQG